MTVTPELDALVRACFADPKQNLPRLVLADYLDEHGESDRATILRLQCELPPPEAGEKAKVKRGAGKELKAAIARLDKTFAPLRRFRVPFEFVRGFLLVRASAWELSQKATLLGRFAALCRAGWVESLVLALGHRTSLTPESMDCLRDVGALDCAAERLDTATLLELATEVRPGLPNSRVQTLTVHPDNQATLAKLLGTPADGPVSPPEWNLWFSDLTPEKTIRLAKSGVLDGAEHVSLYGNTGEAGMRALADTPAMRQATHVSLGHAQMTADVLRPLWRVKTARLESLDLVGCTLGDAGICELCAGEFFPQERLRLHEVGLTKAGVAVLTGCRQLSSLEAVNLHGNLIGNDGTFAILRSPTFGRLTTLNVEGCEVATETAIAAAFAAAPRPELTVGLGNYTVFVRRPDGRAAEFALHRTTYSAPDPGVPLAGTCPEPLSEVWLHQIAGSHLGLPELSRWLAGHVVPSLRLTHCGLRNDDMPDVLKLLGQLKPSRLDLSENEIGLKGLEALAASPTLQTVVHLNLVGNALHVKGILALGVSPYRTALKELTLGRVRWSDAEKKTVKAAFKGVTVQM